MKLYQTLSNTDVHLNNLYRVSVPKLCIVRWSDEELRHTHASVLNWSYTPIPKGTTMPDFWSVR